MTTSKKGIEMSLVNPELDEALHRMMEERKTAVVNKCYNRAVGSGLLILGLGIGFWVADQPSPFNSNQFLNIILSFASFYVGFIFYVNVAFQLQYGLEEERFETRGGKLGALLLWYFPMGIWGGLSRSLTYPFSRINLFLGKRKLDEDQYSYV